MKVTFRTVSGESFSLELEETISVADLKARVTQERGLPPEQLKLVYKGKVLTDDTASLAASGITEAGFIVLFVTTPAKAKQPEPAAAPAPSTAAGPTLVEQQATASTVPAAPTLASEPPAPVQPAAPGGAPAGTYTSAASSLLSGGALEAAVSSIMEMGFERDQVMRAMRAAFNNPERAVEYLATGNIPDTPAPGPAPGPAADAPAAGQMPQAVAAPQNQPFNMFGGPAAGAAPAAAPGLDFGNNPQFQMMRRAVQNNPQLLQPLLQELGRSNPQLLQRINANQQEFLQMMSQPADEDEDAADALGALAGLAEGMPTVIELTPEDDAAIQRLQVLGFDRNACVEAYLACDKDEELAANFLAEQMFD